MKEGISYSFLLNIIIIFVFVCACIIAGIFSYYRAFRAGTIIVNEIEKYEGFNCLSAEAISKKLSGVAYNLPFNVECKDGETNCITDEGKNYKVYSYNSDASSSYFSSEKIEIGDMEYEGSVSTGCVSGFCSMSSKYQYGVYTYMYLDLPIVSNLLKIPIYNKTTSMYDQRSMATMYMYDDNDNYIEYVFDRDILPDVYITDYKKYYCEDYEIGDESCSNTNVSFNYIDALKSYSLRVEKNQTELSTKLNGKELDYYKTIHGFRGPEYNDELKKYGYGLRFDDEYMSPDYNLRDLFRLSNIHVEDAQYLLKYRKKYCGSVTDWSLF